MDSPARFTRARPHGSVRLAIGPFVLLYGAYETVIGLAVGALVQHGNDAPASHQPAVGDAIESLQGNVIIGDPGVAGSVGALAWIVARRAYDQSRATSRAPG